MLRYECLLEFECPLCHKVTMPEVEVPEPKWNEDYGVRHLTSEGPVVVTCEACGKPLEAWVETHPNGSTFTLDNFPDTRVRSTPPHFQDRSNEWEDYEPPENPLSVLNSSLTDASVLLDEKGGGGKSLVNRLVFANFITVFEAFLADTLINKVLGNETALSRLIERDKELSERRFSLAQIAAAPRLIKDTVRARLRSVMWHNIETASALYNKAFEVDILAMFGNDTPTVLKAIEHRHDCVHRNGRDRDGNELDVFTNQYVAQIGQLLYRVASQIEFKFRELGSD